MDYSQIAAEGKLEAIKQIYDFVNKKAQVRELGKATPAMVMVKHIDSLEKTPFYMGEAYVTQCEVEVDGNLGYGCVLGCEENRAVYAAVIDAVMGNKHPLASFIESMLKAAEQTLHDEWETERSRVEATKVKFDVKKG